MKKKKHVISRVLPGSIGEELELGEFTDGKATGRKIDAEIVYIWADWTGLDDDYCIIGFNVTAFDE